MGCSCLPLLTRQRCDMGKPSAPYKQGSAQEEESNLIYASPSYTQPFPVDCSSLGNQAIVAMEGPG